MPNYLEQIKRTGISIEPDLYFLFSAFFLVLYLQVRLCDLHAGQPSLLGQRKTSSKFFKTHYKGIRIVRPFVQFGLLALAGYVGLTRISDFKHHPGDVLTGEISLKSFSRDLVL